MGSPAQGVLCAQPGTGATSASAGSSYRGPGPRASPETSGSLTEKICSQTRFRICCGKSVLSQRPRAVSGGTLPPSVSPPVPAAGALRRPWWRARPPGPLILWLGPSVEQQVPRGPVECDVFVFVDHTDAPRLPAGGRGYKQEEDLDQDPERLRGCQDSGALGWRVSACGLFFFLPFLWFLRLDFSSSIS